MPLSTASAKHRSSPPPPPRGTDCPIRSSRWKASREATKAPQQSMQGYATIEDLKNLNKELNCTIEKQMALLMATLAGQAPAAPAASMSALAATAAPTVAPVTLKAAAPQAALERHSRGRPTSQPPVPGHYEDRERTPARNKARRFPEHETAQNMGATRVELDGRIRSSIGNAPTRDFSRSGATMQQ